MNPPALLALDLSLTRVGVAANHPATGIHVNSLPGRGGGHDRLNQHLVDILAIAAAYRPQLAVIEELYLYPGREGAAIEIAALYHLVRHALWLRRIPYLLVKPVHLRQYAVGKGSGPDVSKQAVLVAMQQLYHRHGIYIRNDDEADASALLSLALDAYGFPLGDQPDSHRRAIQAIEWPALRNPLPGDVTGAPSPGGGESRVA